MSAAPSAKADVEAMIALHLERAKRPPTGDELRAAMVWHREMASEYAAAAGTADAREDKLRRAAAIELGSAMPFRARAAAWLRRGTP